MSTHTPGPWKATPIHGTDGISHAVISEHPSVGYFHIAECSTHDGREYAEANAHLIAAAPELLEACTELLFYAGRYYAQLADDGPEQDAIGPTLDKARAALRKARGRQIPGIDIPKEGAKS